MKLVTDNSVAADNVDVNCVVCGKKQRLSQVFADIEGKSFTDYYCRKCVRDCALIVFTEEDDDQWIT